MPTTATQVKTELKLTDQQQMAIDQTIEVMTKDKDLQGKARSEVMLLLNEVMEGQATLDSDVETMLRLRIEEIDRLLSDQVSAVLHHPKMQKLEATWRGLEFLAKQSHTGTELRLEVFNVSQKELMKDVKPEPSEFDQSVLYKKVYRERLSTAGAAPFSALLGDFELTHKPQHVKLMRGLAGVAAVAHAPLITAASPQMFDMEDFTELDRPKDIATLFNREEYADWREFRKSEDSRYLSLVAPRMLMRLPWGSNTQPVDAFNFEERVSGREHSKYLWGNAAYGLASRLTDSFFLHGWTAAIIGEKSGGKVENLPLHVFKTENGAKATKCPTETDIDDNRWAELAKAGFISLVFKKETNSATFYAAPSTQDPKKFDLPSATASARLSANLPYILATSRFAHYLKVILRTELGQFKSRDQLEAELDRWLKLYVEPSSNASHAMKARHPLQDAEVKVIALADKPGWYEATIDLVPHLQLEAVKVTLRLNAEKPQKK